MADSEVLKIDLNDPNIQVESLELNPDADAFSFPPPPPAGTYKAKLKQKETDGSLWLGRKDKKGGLYLVTQIEARLVIPDAADKASKYDGWPVFDNFVSTMVMENSGTNRVAGVLKALGKSIPARTDSKQLAQLLTAALAEEPTCIITIDWEASAETGTDSDGKKIYKRVKGMKRFPSDGNGGFRSVVDVDGVEAQAQARIVKYSATA